MSQQGDTIYSGCDAAAPKIKEIEEPLIVAVSAATGSATREFETEEQLTVRNLWSDLSSSSLIAVTGQGHVLQYSLQSGRLQEKVSLFDISSQLKAASPDAVDQPSIVFPKIDAEEFLAESGFRGIREGYVYRDVGKFGSGYYRKDIAGWVSAPPVTETQAVIRSYIQRSISAPPTTPAVLHIPETDMLLTASVGSSDFAARVWKMSTESSSSSSGWELVRTLYYHEAPVLCFGVDMCRSLLFTGSYDKTIAIWDMKDWSRVTALKGHGGGIRALALSPDGALLYSAGADNTIRAWDTHTWLCLRTLHGRHDDTCWPVTLALSPNGSLLASGSSGPFGGATIKLFNTRRKTQTSPHWVGDGSEHATSEHGECLATFAHLGFEQKGDVSALCFSSDGGRLYSGASDGTVVAWSLVWCAVQSQGLKKGFL